MHTHLPTGSFGTWTVASLRDSLITQLALDKHNTTLQLYFYAVTNSGWAALRKSVRQWIHVDGNRVAVAYVGTDHAITDPAALERMRHDGVQVRLMQKYQGVFHPKVVWSKGAGSNTIWVGSNNLTRDGLLYNIELAVVVKSRSIPSDLQKWAAAIDSASTPITDELLLSYKHERQKFEDDRAKCGITTFTWGRKREAQQKDSPGVDRGDLIVEVMPKETGSEGTQLQIPVEAAYKFFGIRGSGATKQVMLQSKHTNEKHRLTMTVFPNNTIRLSVSELEYRDRPCVIVFHKRSAGVVSYEIVAQSIFPSRYKSLLAVCKKRTRVGSRRWTIA